MLNRSLFVCLCVLISFAQAAQVDHDRLVNVDQEPGSWLSHGRNYAEDRQSPLTLITPENVSDLGLAWYFDTQTTRGLEASPLVIDGKMYFTTSWSQVFALDARTGELLWHYDPEVPKSWGVNACCDVVNRGVAAWGDAVFVGTLDGRLVALSRDDGRVLWETLTIDPEKAYTITGAPRAVNGKIIIGNGGAEYGVRGYVSAYDAVTGELSWRFYTVPGDPNKAYESQAMRMAAKTWTGDVYWQVGGGGTVWDSMAYDADPNLLYIGVGNGSPWNRWVRSPDGGDNLFLSSIVALNADTGEYVWHYQTTPGDTWDYTATQHMILAELEIRGKTRKVIMQAPKNGFFYVLDRTTGELISADQYVPTTWASHVDLETGRPVETANADHSAVTQTTAPAAFGGHNWQPMAFNTTTGLVYIPAMHALQPFSTDKNFVARTGSHWNLGQGEPVGKGGVSGIPRDMLMSIVKRLMRGYLIAWDPVLEEERWRIEYESLWNGGLLTTKSGLLFQGTGERQFVAYDAASGDELWSTETGTGVVAPPITYALDGEQYVAILAGWGGVGGLSLPQVTQANGTSRLLVYKLGGSLPSPVNPPAIMVLTEEPPALTASTDSIARGEDLYLEHCMRCHGPLVGAGGVVQDLRYISSGTHQIFDQIVLGGIYEPLGMVSFAGVLSEQDVEDVHAFVISATHDTWDQQHDADWWRSWKSWFYDQIGSLVAWVMSPA